MLTSCQMPVESGYEVCHFSARTRLSTAHSRDSRPMPMRHRNRTSDQARSGQAVCLSVQARQVLYIGDYEFMTFASGTEELRVYDPEGYDTTRNIRPQKYRASVLVTYLFQPRTDLCVPTPPGGVNTKPCSQYLRHLPNPPLTSQPAP